MIYIIESKGKPVGAMSVDKDRVGLMLSKAFSRMTGFPVDTATLAECRKITPRGVGIDLEALKSDEPC